MCGHVRNRRSGDCCCFCSHHRRRWWCGDARGRRIRDGGGRGRDGGGRGSRNVRRCRHSCDDNFVVFRAIEIVQRCVPKAEHGTGAPHRHRRRTHCLRRCRCGPLWGTCGGARQRHARRCVSIYHCSLRGHGYRHGCGCGLRRWLRRLQRLHRRRKGGRNCVVEVVERWVTNRE